MKEFRYEITEHIATISESADRRFTLELNRISYNGAPAKLDLRRWNRQDDRMQKGLVLTEEEAGELKAILEQIFDSVEDKR
ncbi:YdbC family protein [Lachnoclostridium sp. An138]|uniref:YdbC family protein n=1 Tax=Lachnoclostridium sp. An138 TaxID=1965560 RepID=UPI000B3826E3|nr:PC4/YdbC family ssDNA-binding protein [Lachnoclostridium sp. An138]OUQ13819.1 hypothetical protein B5E82_17275 [Lachnoclostridium sp. An138]